MNAWFSHRASRLAHSRRLLKHARRVANSRRILELVAVTATLLIAAPRGASAQILAQVNPVKMSLTVRPDQPLHRDVQISNLGDSAVAVRVRLADWDLSEYGALSLAPAGSTSSSLAGLLTFGAAEFTLSPGQAHWLHLTLTLPTEGPATHWGVLLSEIRAATPAPATGATPGVAPAGRGASTELGTTIFLSRIPSDEVRAAIGPPDVVAVGGDSILVSARVHNTGERPMNVATDFALSDSSGTRLQIASIGSCVVLPGHARRLEWTWVARLKPGGYKVTATLDIGAPDPLTSEANFHWPPVPPTGSMASRPAR